jgi:ABC-type Zn uptake system ZnuABC Zn-binding protein ZnuA
MTNRLAPLLIALGWLGAGPAWAKLDIVTTTPDYAALAEAVGGEEITVKVLAKPTEDPHFVDAKPSHLVTLNRADLLVESGAELEIGWLPPLVEGARNKNLLPGAAGRFLGSDGIRLLDVPAVLDRSQGDVHGRGNPHFLMDPLNAARVAERLAERFCQLDAASCPTYRQNLARFEEALSRKIKDWSAKLAPYAGSAIVTYHNTWRYFADRFGLRADTFLEPKPGIPPSPPHLAGVIAAMKAQGMKVILVEPFQSRKTAETVAGHAGAVVVDVCQFPGGVPGTDGDYLSLMDANVSAITGALARTGGS